MQAATQKSCIAYSNTKRNKWQIMIYRIERLRAVIILFCIKEHPNQMDEVFLYAG